MQTLLTLLLGCDEILTNVIKHAYGLENMPSPARFGAGLKVSPSLIRFIIRHHGAGITQEQAAAQADLAPARKAATAWRSPAGCLACAFLQER